MKQLSILFSTVLLSLICRAETPLFLSLGFDSQGTYREIEGVRVDLNNHRALAHETGLPFLQYNDADLAAAGTKEEFLAKMRKSMDGHDEILFAYSGHGFNGEQRAEYDTEKKSISRPIKIDPEELKAQMEEMSEALNSPSKIKDVPKCPDDKKSEFLIGTGESIKCLGNCSKSCTDKCTQDNLKENKPYSAMEEQCYRGCNGKKDRKGCRRACDTADSERRKPVVEKYRRCQFECEENILQQACAQSCKDKMITTKDLAKLFEGKKVTAIVDACHSGALKDFNHPQFSTWAAIDANSPTPDDPESGGLLNKNIFDSLKNNACELDVNKDGEVTFNELYGKRDRDKRTGCVTGSPQTGMKNVVLKTIDRSKDCVGTKAGGGADVQR